ncbi:MAG TPA: MFS transporter [Methylomirabilota bacterium]|jgi:MFS family permease|nr:MFS transporter [Methylomirabilota bacterium]
MSNRWVALVLVFLTRSSMGFQFGAIPAAQPLIVADLHLSYAQFGWVFGLYLLPGVVFAAPGGLIGQRFGERRVVIGGLALMAIGATMTALAGGFATATAGRLVSGVGAVLMNILLSRLISDWFAGKELATAMAVMLTSWPVGLGLATSTLGGVAAHWGWRWMIVLTAAAALLGLALMLIFREAPRVDAGPQRAALTRRDVAISVAGGFAWGCFNASLVVIIAFAPALLLAQGTTLGQAGSIVSLAIWLTIVSIPLGGLLGDRLGRPNLMIVAGSLVAAAVTLAIPVVTPAVLAFCLVGFAIGPPPGPLMALLPRALPPERLTTGFGVFYTVFYVMMALTQPLAGFVRDRAADPVAPIVFAAVVMAATVAGLGLFRWLEQG